jgi:hypothetical protein
MKNDESNPNNRMTEDRNAKAARRRAQEYVRKYISPKISLSEELLADRKRESQNH